MTKRMFSKVLTYSAVVATGTSGQVAPIPDTFLAEEDIEVHAVQCNSELHQHDPQQVVAGSNEFRIDMEVTQNSIQNGVGSLAKLSNVYFEGLAAAGGVNNINQQLSQNSYAAYPVPFSIKEEGVISLLVGVLNNGGVDMQMNCAATIYYTRKSA